MPAVLAENLKRSFAVTQKEPGLFGSVKALFKPNRTYVEAVKGIDLSIEQGELVGFLGPNGAGKTTTIKMLTGILYPTSGRAEVLGFTPFDRKQEMLKQVSLVMGNKNQLWWDLPAMESFRVMKEVYEVSDADFKKRLDRLVDALDMGEKVNSQVRKMSLGERMKCELIAALLHNPKVVFLDEPTIGLDLVSQRRIREFLQELNRETGCTIMLTSHYMQDVQELCDRIVVIDHGTKVFDGALDALLRDYADTRRLKLTLSEDVSRETLETFGSVTELEANVATLAIASSDVTAITARALSELPVADVALESVSLDEIIRDIFGRGR